MNRRDVRMSLDSDPNAAWDTHRTLLTIAIREAAPGSPVLELGTGYGSTRQLHALCAETGHPLVSYENNPVFHGWFQHLDGPGHSVRFVKDYAEADIETTQWGVAFVDHSPASRRPIDARRLAAHCDVLVVHDTSMDAAGDGGENANGTIWPLFRYRCDCWMTTAVSSRIDVRAWAGRRLGPVPGLFCQACGGSETDCAAGCQGPEVLIGGACGS